MEVYLSEKRNATEMNENNFEPVKSPKRQTLAPRVTRAKAVIDQDLNPQVQVLPVTTKSARVTKDTPKHPLLPIRDVNKEARNLAKEEKVAVLLTIS